MMIVPEVMNFDLTESGDGGIELWAATGLRCFRAKILGTEVIFKSNGRERCFGDGRLLRGFSALSVGERIRSEAENLCPEVCLLASLRRVP